MSGDYIVRYTLTFLAVAACSSRRAAQESEVLAPSALTTILRETSFEDPDLAARNMGRLEIVVRSADRPTQALPSAAVLVRVNGRDSLQRLTDQQGLVRLDSVPVGDHEIMVRRIGYAVARASVPVKRGCRTDAEVYISIAAIGIAPPPSMPTRITVTTCR